MLLIFIIPKINIAFLEKHWKILFNLYNKYFRALSRSDGGNTLTYKIVEDCLHEVKDDKLLLCTEPFFDEGRIYKNIHTPFNLWAQYSIQVLNFHHC